MSTIIMTEEYWATSQFSIARYYGGIKVGGVDYVIVNKEGKDIYECSIEAKKARREKAIEPGEPADLIDRRYISMYKKLGRDKFIEWVKEGLDLAAMKKRLKEGK
jgi:hypothetical protein